MFYDSASVSQFLSKLDEKRGYTDYWLKLHPDDKKKVSDNLLNDKDKARIQFLIASDLLFSENYTIAIGD